MARGGPAHGHSAIEVRERVETALAATATEATDEQLVAAARDGSDEAFEALFTRYRDRIIGQVRTMIHDQSRAEDIVQETFISALRNLRATEQEIAFRPWIHQIARNACIDHLRRVKRTEEISIDSDEFGPGEGRLSQTATGTDAAVARRNQLESLRRRSTTCRPRSTRYSSCASSRACPTTASATAWASRGERSRSRSSAAAGPARGFDEIDTGELAARGCAAPWRALSTAIEVREGGPSIIFTCASCAGVTRSRWTRLAVSASRKSRARRRAGGCVASFLPLLFLRRRLATRPAGSGGNEAGVEQGATLAGKAMPSSLPRL